MLNHVVSGAVGDVESSVFNGLAVEMIAYVDMFRTSVEVVCGGNFACGLGVGDEMGSTWDSSVSFAILLLPSRE
jgi:hypothetical protein